MFSKGGAAAGARVRTLPRKINSGMARMDGGPSAGVVPTSGFDATYGAKPGLNALPQGADTSGMSDGAVPLSGFESKYGPMRQLPLMHSAMPKPIAAAIQKPVVGAPVGAPMTSFPAPPAQRPPGGVPPSRLGDIAKQLGVAGAPSWKPISSLTPMAVPKFAK